MKSLPMGGPNGPSHSDTRQPSCLCTNFAQGLYWEVFEDSSGSETASFSCCLSEKDDKYRIGLTRVQG